MRWTHDLENGGLIFDMRKNASAKMLRRLLLAMAAAFCLTMLALPAAAQSPRKLASSKDPISIS